LRTGKTIHTLQQITSYFINGLLAITPKGNCAVSNTWESIVTASGPYYDAPKKVYWKNNCIIWNIRTGQLINKIEGHLNEKVIDVKITPDGKRLISINEHNCIIWDLDSKKKAGIFFTETKISSASYFPEGIFLKDESGQNTILVSSKEFLCPHRSIVTIRRIWDFDSHKYSKSIADCPSCGHHFYPSALTLSMIAKIHKKSGLKNRQSPCLELPNEAWEDPGLLGNCPKCGVALKFNPFIAGGDYKPEPKWKFWKR
jgi:WD40 repeat protein